MFDKPKRKMMLITRMLLIATTLLAACTPAGTQAVEPTTAGTQVADPTTAQVQPTEAAASPTQTQASAGTTAAPTGQGASTEGILVTPIDGTQQFARNLNPFFGPPTGIGYTAGSAYEPMMIWSRVTGEYIPWLATEYQWNDDATQLTFKIRPEVLWSDGEPFTANDVVFTFEMLKANAGLDLGGVWNNVSSVTAPDESTVVFDLNKPYVPALLEISQTMIVPEHIWKDVDPMTYTAEKIVATGPFTEVTMLTSTAVQLEKNPNYWQEGKPELQGVRYVAVSEDAFMIAIGNGEYDWASTPIPDVQRVYADKDPEHFKWGPQAVGNATFVHFNHTKKPFDDVKLRKALSMAIDRQMIIDNALTGFGALPDATGLTFAFENWKDEELMAANADLVTLNVDKANQLLDEAGYAKGPNGMRTMPDGTPFQIFLDNAGWVDYAAVSEIVAQNFRTVGIDAQARTFSPDAWFDKVFKGDFDAVVGWSALGSTPYNTYHDLMSADTYVPVGETAGANWGRVKSERADELLAQLAATGDEAEQKEIAKQLQQVYVDEYPHIVIYNQVNVIEYNTTRIEGWPDPATAPVSMAAYSIPESLVIYTMLRPKQQ